MSYWEVDRHLLFGGSYIDAVYCINVASIWLIGHKLNVRQSLGLGI